LAGTVAIWVKVILSTLRSILNPSSLMELSLHDSLICKQTGAAVAVSPEGGAGVGVGVAVGLGVGVGVGVAHTPEPELAVFEYGEFPAALNA
jgi:hypothetical protein